MNGTRVQRRVQAVAIGASAGAVDALLQLLSPLPADYPLPLLIVVHLPPSSESTLATLLAARCQIAVKEAEDKEITNPGTAYLAPPNYHLMVEPDFSLSLSNDEPVLFSRPSIDVLFESAADAYGDGLVGMILTGSNTDGAHGLRVVEENGGRPIVQNPSSATYPEMPQAALDSCPSARALTLPELSAFLLRELPCLTR